MSKKCSLDRENTGFWGTPSPPPPTKEKTPLNCLVHELVQATSNRNVYTIFEENQSNNAKYRVRQIYLFYSSINIYTVLKYHVTAVLGTTIGGSFHRQGAGSYHDSYQWTFIFVCYLSTSTNYGIVLIIQIRLRNFAG